MSGDTQPRKRKDKKKRKEEGVDFQLSSNEDIAIHVQKEGGTGGNICAKIVFFLLFSALIALVALIIKENQGLKELNNKEIESRYSHIFEGWVETNSDDDHKNDDHSSEIEHDNSDEHQDDDDDDDEHEAEESDENNDSDQTLESDEQSESQLSDSTLVSNEVTEEESEEQSNVSEDKSEIKESSEDISKKSSEVEDEEEEEAEEEEEKDTNESDEKNKSVEQSAESDDDKTTVEPDSKQHIEHDNSEEKEQAAEDLAQSNPDDTNKGGAGIGTKIGVGVALLVVAYKVFLRKRNSDFTEIITNETEVVTPVVSRRNTIVPPPTLEEVEPDLREIEYEEEAYSAGEDEDYSDEDSRSEHKSVREEYEELRESYTYSLTPEGEFELKGNNIEDENIESDDIDEREDLLEETDEELNDDDDDDDDEDEESVDSEISDYDEEAHEELLKKLEAKYGKLGRDDKPVESNSVTAATDATYEYSNISNENDLKIRKEIDAAQEHLLTNAAYANKLFDVLLQKYSRSPRCLYGKAQALDILADQHKSNDYLKQALSYYSQALDAHNVPDALFVKIANRFADRAKFMGQYQRAIRIHKRLIEKFPENLTYLNNLAVIYLTINQIEEAKILFQEVLAKWPHDGFALVHYGFILKTTDNNLREAVTYLKKGLQTKASGVVDGRFYFHLGDALARLHKTDEAMKVYEEGVAEKVFLSKYQRSLYNVNRLKAKPWWEIDDFPSYKKLFLMLKKHWWTIRHEGLSLLNNKGFFQDESENLKDKGTWKQYELFARGHKSVNNCAKAPVTCGIIEKFPIASKCKRGQTKFSVIHPNTHIWPHCGPTNCRLRLHLGLEVPSNTYIRVAEETRSWIQGDIIIFDDSFEHEVWHNGSDVRLVLIVDIWHPDLTDFEKEHLTAI